MLKLIFEKVQLFFLNVSPFLSLEICGTILVWAFATLFIYCIFDNYYSHPKKAYFGFN